MQMLWTDSRILFLGRSDLVIHPGITFAFARTTWRLETFHKELPWRHAEIACRVAASGASIAEHTVRVPRAELATILGFDATYLFPNG